MISFTASTLALLAVLVAAFGSRQAARGWRLAMRREVVWVQALMVTQEIARQAHEGEPLEPDEIEGAVAPVMVAIADELHAQAHLGRWRLPPQVGKPWPPSTPPAPLGQWDDRPADSVDGG